MNHLGKSEKTDNLKETSVFLNTQNEDPDVLNRNPNNLKEKQDVKTDNLKASVDPQKNPDDPKNSSDQKENPDDLKENSEVQNAKADDQKKNPNIQRFKPSDTKENLPLPDAKADNQKEKTKKKSHDDSKKSDNQKKKSVPTKEKLKLEPPASAYFQTKSGHIIPYLGFGTVGIPQEKMNECIDLALGHGYRLFDTTSVSIDNEISVGVALQAGMKKHNLKRHEIFITCKLMPVEIDTAAATIETVEQSLHNLKTKYIDLYLVQHPGTFGILSDENKNREVRIAAYKALISCKSGKPLIENVGVCNFEPDQVEELFIHFPENVPAVVQMELHPYCYHTYPHSMLEWYKKEQIFIQAHSSLGTPDFKYLLERDDHVAQVVKEVNEKSSQFSDSNNQQQQQAEWVKAGGSREEANSERATTENGEEKTDKIQEKQMKKRSWAQVLLRWAYQHEVGIIPRATTEGHIKENIDLDFEIKESMMKRLDKIKVTKKFT